MSANPRKLFLWRRAFTEHGPKSSSVRHVLWALSGYMDTDGGACFPSQTTLAKDTCCSLRAVRDALHAAAAAGWITRTTRGTTGQGWRLYQYTPAIPEDVRQLLPHLKPGKLTIVDTKRAANNAKRAANNDQKVRHPLPPNSSINSSIELPEKKAVDNSKTVLENGSEEKPKTEERLGAPKIPTELSELKSLHEGGAHWDMPEFKALPPDSSRHAPKSAPVDVLLEIDLEESRRAQVAELRKRMGTA